MDRQEIINNIGYIADKKAKEYVEQRKSHGVNDPYMLNEIEEAYYEGMVQSENFWHPASELPPVDKNGNSGELIAITSDGNLMRVYFHYESDKYNFWVESDDWNKQVQYGVNVKWWCYPPKED